MFVIFLRKLSRMAENFKKKHQQFVKFWNMKTDFYFILKMISLFLIQSLNIFTFYNSLLYTFKKFDFVNN
jgi:hypothetical protein